MKNWRFRSNFTGKLILQRKISWNEDYRDFEQWIDATVSDLADYYKELGETSK